MKTLQIVGIALILIGAIILGYNHFNYTTEEKVLEIGPLKATAERTHTVTIPPIIGWVMIGGGALVLALGFKKD